MREAQQSRSSALGRLSVLAAMAGLLSTSGEASAKQVPTIDRRAPAIVQPQAGDCHVTVRLPVDSGELTAVVVRGDPIDLANALIGPREVVVPLENALGERQPVSATANGVEYSVRVEKRRTSTPDPYCINVTRGFDDRPSFEAHGFLGKSYDNFIPVDSRLYKDEKDATKDRWRNIGGLNIQYRLIGNGAKTFQFWGSGWVLHGVRSGDVDCPATPTPGNPVSPLCERAARNNTQEQFLTTLKQASSLEAHFEAREEFLIYQVDNTDGTPFKLFLSQRWGWVALRDSPKLFRSENYGLGVLIPVGNFRGSSVTWGIGKTETFQSDPGWGRFKVNALLAFDIAPGLKQFKLGKALGFGSWRAFIDIAVDRHPRWFRRGTNKLLNGPDSVQTYVGFAFDIRNAFSPF